MLAGKYRLEMLLGEGGMASVWSAYHLELELPVAIKLLRGGTSNARLVERLRLEARAGAHLVHPSTVRIFDIATTDDGEPFIVMELLSGESLAQALSRGRMSSVRAVQLMLPIAEALALAHSHGIVHRDLKPDNVFLSNESDQVQPKLLDFGIAKAARSGAARDKLTQRGTVLGSPYYMSPEQVRGDDVDYRTDIWSFCVVLYKAVVGKAPFRGPDKRAVLDAIASDEPARVPAGIGIDEHLARLMCWGLCKDPARRPSSIRELGRHLAHWLISQGVSEDASGAPIAAKWIAKVSEPGLRRPPPYAEMREPVASERGSTLASTAPLELVTERIAAGATQGSSRSHLRRWALLAGASLLIVSGSVARTDSHRAEGPERGADGLAAARPSTPEPVVRALFAEIEPTTAPAARPPREHADAPAQREAPDGARDEAPEHVRDEAPEHVRDEARPAREHAAHESLTPATPKQSRPRTRPTSSASSRLPF